MPTTFSNLVPVRRVAVGDCSGPLGSGFDALARSAYTALLRSGWTESADPPFLPVHDNGQTANKTIPRGDAWKCSYGYDAAARTERSACGAVCYTFALPPDAYSGTPANISTVTLSLTGDRYLDAGVDLYIVPSASPTPPTIPEILALTPVGTYCATSDQSPTKPNERHGVTEAVEATPGVAAQPYLHVALLLHDYTTNRGAWIEGGAMLEGATATIAFSREVAEDAPQFFALNIAPEQQAIHSKFAMSMRGSRENWTYSAYIWGASGSAIGSDAFSTAAGAAAASISTLESVGKSAPTISQTASDLSNLSTMSLMVNGVQAEYDPNISYSVGDNAAYGGVVYRCKSATTGAFDPAKWDRLRAVRPVRFTWDDISLYLGCFFLTLVRSGIVPSGVYRRIMLSQSISPTIPVRVAIYGFSPAPHQVGIHAGTIGSEDFWNGRATHVDAFSGIPQNYALKLWDQTMYLANGGSSPNIGFTSIPAAPLAAFDLAPGESIGPEIAISPMDVDCYDLPMSIMVAIRPAYRQDIDETILKGEYAVPDLEISIAP